MKMTLILLGAAVGGPMRFVIDQKIRTYTTKPYGIFADWFAVSAVKPSRLQSHLGDEEYARSNSNNHLQ